MVSIGSNINRPRRTGANITKAQLKQARTRLDQLEKQLGRIQQLHDKDLNSEQEFDNIQSRVESARADIQLAQAQPEQAFAKARNSNWVFWKIWGPSKLAKV